ncbi:MAG: cache domain-containing protein [Nanoarchaeota archaeon]
MALRLRSLKTNIFILTFLVVLIPVVIISLLSIQVFESQLAKIEEQNLINNALVVQHNYESGQNDLLKTGIFVTRSVMSKENTSAIKEVLENALLVQHVDIATLVDREGRVIVSATAEHADFSHDINQLVVYAVQNRIPMVSTEIIPALELESEDASLAQSSMIRRIPTLYQDDVHAGEYITDGFGIVAVIPIMEENEVTSVLILVDLLTRDNRFPDSIKDMTGLDVSLFQGDVRIATTVLTEKGNRFIGTLLPKEVVRRTLEEGRMYNGRVWVVNRWSMATYLPVKDFKGQVIGAIGYESSETDLRKTMFLFRETNISHIIIYLALIILAISLGITYAVSRRITKPLLELEESIRKVNEGNLEQGVTINSYDEINDLAKSFNIMIRYLRKQMVKKERDIIREFQKRRKDE